MADRFTPEHDLITPALALCVWAAHFGLVWTASVVFPDEPAARWIALGLTVIAMAALVGLARRARVKSPFSAAGLGIGIAAAGIAFDTLPALLG